MIPMRRGTDDIRELTRARIMVRIPYPLRPFTTTKFFRAPQTVPAVRTQRTVASVDELTRWCDALEYRGPESRRSLLYLCLGGNRCS
jgi:hypothetical protein